MHLLCRAEIDMSRKFYRFGSCDMWTSFAALHWLLQSFCIQTLYFSRILSNTWSVSFLVVPIKTLPKLERACEVVGDTTVEHPKTDNTHNLMVVCELISNEQFDNFHRCFVFSLKRSRPTTFFLRGTPRTHKAQYCRTHNDTLAIIDDHDTFVDS